MSHVAKRGLSAAAVRRIALALALALVVLAVCEWEERLPGISYLREQAHKVHRGSGRADEVPDVAPGGGEGRALHREEEQVKKDSQVPLPQVVEQDAAQQNDVEHGHHPNGEDEKLNNEELDPNGRNGHQNVGEEKPSDNDKHSEHPEPDIGDHQPDDLGEETKLDGNEDKKPASGNDGKPTSNSKEKLSKVDDKPQGVSKPSSPGIDPLLPPVGQSGNKGTIQGGNRAGDANAGGDNKSVEKGPGKKPSGATEETASENGDGTSAAKLTDEPCLKYIVYDKPVKTGSSAVTSAIRSYLETLGQTADRCTKDECTEMAQAICAGKQKPRALIGHMFGEDGLLECLRKQGYYVVTSIREPLARWESAYLFNKKKESTHYGISYEEGYKFFMEKFPACSLYQYYDSSDPRCRLGTPVEGRIKPIVARYDEIIDLYDDGKPRGQLYEIIAKYIRELNRSPRPGEEFREGFDKTRLDNETKLYTALKKRSEEILKKGQTPLCS